MEDSDTNMYKRIHDSWYSFYCNQGPRMSLKDFKYAIVILLKYSVQNRDLKERKKYDHITLYII